MDKQRLHALARPLALLLLFVPLYLVLERLVGMLGGALIAGAALLYLGERRPVTDLGIGVSKHTPAEIGIGLLIPVLALLIVFAPLALLSIIEYRAQGGSLRLWLAGTTYLLLWLALPAAAEEALFRGYPFQKLVELVGPVLATLGASAAFAVAHGNNPSIGVFALVNIFLAGVVLSVAYLKTRSLWFAFAVHLGWNWQMGGPLDLPISGLELYDTPLYEPHALGPAWLTGGRFGLEGGLAGLVALALVLAGILAYTRKFGDGGHK